MDKNPLDAIDTCLTRMHRKLDIMLSILVIGFAAMLAAFWRILSQLATLL